jgi:putative transcriptional regulator
VPKPGFRGQIRWLPLILVLLAPAALHGATPPRPDDKPGRAYLTGQLLIAAPSMGDPRFQNTVLVMVRHDAEGAMGLVVNRPAGEQPLVELLKAIGLGGEGVSGAVPVFVGGPVERQRLFVLHSSDYRRTGTLDITSDLAVTATPEVFRDIAAKAGPAKFLVAFGYAGWGAGQLEGELARSSWYTASLDLRLVFDADRDKVWELAVERRTRDL